MLEPVYLAPQALQDHAAPAGADAVARLRELAAPLAGLRVLHLSATPYGGGVAELLRSEIPLLRDLGVNAEWRLIRGDERFFAVTKAIHNGLQGAGLHLGEKGRAEYLSHSTANAAEVDGDYDVVVAHDPQPLALRTFCTAGSARWIWRCHIDTSTPDRRAWQFVRSFVSRYDAAVFTARQFVPPDLANVAVHIIPPAIDPLSPKNIDLPEVLARRLVSWMGLDLRKPLIAQISRFDRWKDPFGVIAVYRLVRQHVPGVELAMVASMALDDPEAWEIHRRLQAEAVGDQGIHLFTNLTGVGSVEVNAVQRLAGVILQKSIKEGFGLVVSEALWKGTPVVATPAGGIPLQLRPGVGGFLAESTEECAERVAWLLTHDGEADDLGSLGRERIRRDYLITRLLADDLRLYRTVTAG